MKKKILSTLLCLCMVMTMSSTIAMAQTSTMVALGDSISTGYGLENYVAKPLPMAKDSFVNVLSAKIGYTPVNLAVDGLTSQDLAKGLQAATLDKTSKEYTALATAGVISITIGGNDLLNVLFQEVGTALGMNVTSPAFKAEVMTKVATAFATNDMATLLKINGVLVGLPAKVTPVAATFSANLTQIVTAIKQINPAAVVVLQTIANPYKDIQGISAPLNAGVEAFNAVITKGATAGGYVVADTYTAFANSKEVLTNASNPKTLLDPHPNKAGHAVIAQLIEPLLKGTIVTPPTEKDTVAPVIAGVKNGGKYCKKVTITVTDDNLKSIKLNGRSLKIKDSNKYVITAKLTKSKKAMTQRIVATDKSGNVTKVKITIYKNHRWNKGVTKEGVKTYTCKVCDRTKTKVIK